VNSIRSEQQNAKADDSADFIEFLGLAGLGQAEAANLTWGDVDWEKEVLMVRRQKTKALFFPPIYPDLKLFLRRLYSRFPVHHCQQLAYSKFAMQKSPRERLQTIKLSAFHTAKHTSLSNQAIMAGQGRYKIDC
jgi:integrase